MSRPPRFSVIIPTCGREDLVIESVDSIVANTFQDFEIIVVDQNQDQSLRHQLNKRYAGREIIYVHLDLQSASRARNTGIETARGEILVFLDDDAVVESDWLQAYSEAFDEAPEEVGALAGRILPRWGAKIPRWLPENRIGSLGIYDRGIEPMAMPDLDLIVGANFAILRAAAAKTGPFNEDLGPSYARSNSMLTGEDSLYSIRIVESGYQIRYVPTALVHHYIGGYKLRLSYLLRRYYWEGFTYVCVMSLAGSIRRDACGAIIKFHSKKIIHELFSVCDRDTVEDPWIPGAAKVVGVLCEIAKSAGLIRACFRLRRRGVLP